MVPVAPTYPASSIAALTTGALPTATYTASGLVGSKTSSANGTTATVIPSPVTAGAERLGWSFGVMGLVAVGVAVLL